MVIIIYALVLMRWFSWADEQPVLLLDREEEAMTGKEQIQMKLSFEIESKKDTIQETAKLVKDYALMIQGELADVIRMADQVLEQTEEAINFPIEPWRGSSWNSLMAEIVKLDTAIRAYRQVKRVIWLSSELAEEEG
jgi:hypothetical protein